MSDRDALMDALRRADAAGDTAAAQAIARRIQSVSVAPGAPSGGTNAAAPGGSPPQGQPGAPEGMLNADGSSPMMDRIQYGLANVGIKAYHGLKQTLGGTLTPEELAISKMSDADVEHSGFAGKTANLAGNLGLGVASSIAVPASAVTKIPAFLRAVLGSGISAAALTETDDPDHVLADKLKEGAKAAAMGGVITGGAQVLKKSLTKMVTPTADAQSLFDQGINPTLQQASESKLGRWIGGLTSGMSDVRARQEEEALAAIAKRASAGALDTKGMTAGEAVGTLNHSIDKDYGGVLDKKMFPMTNAIRDDVLRQGEIGKSGGRFGQQQAEARDVLDNIVGSDRNSTRMNSDVLRKNYLDPMQQAIADAKDPRVSEALVNAKNVIIEKSRNSKLSPDELATLKDIDSRYYDMMRLREASKGAASNETGVDINKLANSYGKGPGADVIGSQNATNEALVGPLVRTLGATPRQDEARTFYNTLRRIGGMGVAGGATAAVPGLAALTAPAYAISAAGQTAKGSRFLTGQNDWQKNLKSALESPQTSDFDMANILRALRDNSSTIGAGLTAGQ